MIVLLQFSKSYYSLAGGDTLRLADGRRSYPVCIFSPLGSKGKRQHHQMVTWDGYGVFQPPGNQPEGTKRACESVPSQQARSYLHRMSPHCSSN